MNNFKIAISGELGSGKTLLSKLLSEKLNCELISIGIIQRKLAEKYGMSIIDFNKYMEKHQEIDIECDNMIKDYGISTSCLILDSRLAWYFIPNSYKIHLIIDQTIATERIFIDKTRNNEKYVNIDETKRDIYLRKVSEKTRFQRIYNINIDDFTNYNLIIDSSHISPEDLVKTVLKEIDIWLEMKEIQNPKIYISPKNIFPTQSIREHSLKYTLDLQKSMHLFGYDEHFPIDVIQIDNEFFIFDGHKRCSAAIQNNLSLIPALLFNLISEVLPNGEKIYDYIKNSYNLKNVYDWESMHKFKFSHYYYINS
jgi:cytidylate kinase